LRREPFSGLSLSAELLADRCLLSANTWAGMKRFWIKSPEDRKPAVIRSQEKKWHVIPEQFAAFAGVKPPSFF
jgi:hypothetical protein